MDGSGATTKELVTDPKPAVPPPNLASSERLFEIRTANNWVLNVVVLVSCDSPEVSTAAIPMFPIPLGSALQSEGTEETQISLNPADAQHGPGGPVTRPVAVTIIPAIGSPVAITSYSSPVLRSSPDAAVAPMGENKRVCKFPSERGTTIVFWKMLVVSETRRKFVYNKLSIVQPVAPRAT